MRTVRLLLWSAFLLCMVRVSVTESSDSTRPSPHGRSTGKYRKGEIAVKFRPSVETITIKGTGTVARTGITSVDTLLARYKVMHIEKRFKHKPIPQNSGLPDLSRIYRLRFPEAYEPTQVSAALAADPHVEYAEPIFINTIEENPNDPKFLEERQRYLDQIYAPEAWDIEHGDSTIVIAIVDNGTNWEHPDLHDNIWTNESEAQGLAGVDDDGNGYLDDIHGYDLAEDDSDPTNSPSGLSNNHGTHTAGLAGAVTNNGIGIASISWNCEIMPVKASFDEEPQYVDVGYDGILYAAENGADIISLSWGNFKNYSQADQDVVNYAYGLGSIVVAAAGNDPSSDPHYPSGYVNVISVGWVSSQDVKAPTGAWGIGVDVCAPGVNLYSTVPNNPYYGYSSGSSMACPLVAGLCGLVKAHNPDWSNDEIVRQVVLTADTIDEQNPMYVGQLGSGRMNALRALTEIEPPEVTPRFELFSVSTDDARNGDGDGLFERGEEITVAATLRNYAVSPATDVTVTIGTTDPDLFIVDGSSVISFFPSDTFATTQDPLSFSIAPNTEAHMAKLYIDFTAAEGGSGSDTIFVIVGQMPILLVDDDDGDNNVEDFYTFLFDSLEVQYAHWDHLIMGPPSGSLLSAFPIVVWLCEWAFPSLEPEDRAAIGHFLDNGGNLFLSGQDIGWDFYDPDGYALGFSDWYETYLHAVYYEDDSPVHDVVGVDGDVISDGLSFGIWQPGRKSDEQYPEEIEPTPDADAIFFYKGGQHHKTGIKFEGPYKVVYLGIGFEAIGEHYTVTPDPQENWETRMVVMKRILNWMNFVRHTPIRDREGTTQPIPVAAQITDEHTDITDVSLFWKKGNDADFIETHMNHQGGDHYTAEIPPPGDSTTISYYFAARNPYFQWQTPVGAGSAHGDMYSFRLGLDEVPPEFQSIEQLRDTYRKNGSATVKTVVRDNIGIKLVSLYFQKNDSPVDSVTMTPTGQPHEYEGVITWSGERGDEIGYMIEATDSSANRNTTTSATFSFFIVNTVLLDDFESGTGKWDLGEEWGLVAPGYYSDYSITDSPSKFYENNADNALTLLEPLDLSSCSTAAVTFWHRYNFQHDQDFGFVEVSLDGETWHQPASYTGDQFLTVKDSLSLNDFCGFGNEQVALRFRLVSDASDTNDGWHLDDITLWVDMLQTGIDEHTAAVIPETFTLQQNYPNPFNAGTDIRYQIPEMRHPTHITLKIYNLLGQEIKTLVDDLQESGFYSTHWNGKDNIGRNSASGIYFYRFTAESGNLIETKRMILLR